MIQTVAKCPKCGAAHNPLVHPSFREETDDLPGGDSPSAADTANFTWLCESCGETYQLDLADSP